MNIDYDIETSIIQLSQNRYVTETVEGADEMLYWIPYNFVTPSEITQPEFAYTYADEWLSTRSDTLSPTTERDWTGADWVLFNKEQTGYYRVNYNRENWLALANALKSLNAGGIKARSRAQLIEDSFQLTFDGHLTYDIPLTIANYPSVFEEQDPFVYIQLFNKLLTIERRLLGSPIYENWKVRFYK